MTFNFKKATKTQSRLRLAFAGPAGSGKTLTSLRIASILKRPVCVIDTERGSASKYAGLRVVADEEPLEFDVLELETFSPNTYVEALIEAGKRGYGTVIIDSLSHAWMGKDGALEQVDKFAKRSQSSNTFAAWRDVTPMHNRLVDTILSCPMHVIATMRSKTEYVMEDNDRGKKTPRKIGMAPVQRDGLEYEFDVYADMTVDNEMIVGKTRCSSLAQKVFRHPGRDVAEILKAWISDGVEMPERRKSDQPPAPSADVSSGEDVLVTWLNKGMNPEHVAKVASLKLRIDDAKLEGTDEARKALIDAIKQADLPAAAMGEVRKAYADAFRPQAVAS